MKRNPMSQTNITPFFEPLGVVLVGARRSPGFGYGIPFLLKDRGWEDRMYLVNPNGGDLEGMKLYQRIKDIKKLLDLGIVLVPAPHVPQTLIELAAQGVRHIIIESAGFAEAGKAGIALQAEVAKIMEEHSLRIIGPNCIGVVNNDNGFTTTEILPEAFPLGNTSIVAQSGVFGNILLDYFHQLDLFVSKAVTLGNRIDVNECEVLDYLKEDPSTQLILLYLEGAAQGRELTDTLKQVTREKPVLILKSGKTGEGKAATASHTGSLSGEDEIYSGMFKQTGAVRVESLDELVVFSTVFSTQPLPRGNRIGIITGSGSLGALSTDAAVSGGLTLPPPSPITVEKVKTVAPDWMNIKNPLDVGPSGTFRQALTALMADPEIDMVLAIANMPHAVFVNLRKKNIDGNRMFGNMQALREQHPEKPLLICVVGHKEIHEHMKEIAGPNIPIIQSPEAAAKSLAALWQYRCWRERSTK